VIIVMYETLGYDVWSCYNLRTALEI